MQEKYAFRQRSKGPSFWMVPLARQSFAGPDAPRAKPRSLVADFTLLPEAVEAALAGEQLQPILLAPGDA